MVISRKCWFTDFQYLSVSLCNINFVSCYLHLLFRWKKTFRLIISFGIMLSVLCRLQACEHTFDLTQLNTTCIQGEAPGRLQPSGLKHHTSNSCVIQGCLSKALVAKVFLFPAFEVFLKSHCDPVWLDWSALLAAYGCLHRNEHLGRKTGPPCLVFSVCIWVSA